jgi:hypothetical protein
MAGTPSAGSGYFVVTTFIGPMTCGSSIGANADRSHVRTRPSPGDLHGD